MAKDVTDHCAAAEILTFEAQKSKKNKICAS
jgi:hypothetical protein